MKKKIDYQGLLGEANPLLNFLVLYDAALDEFSKRKFEDASLNEILKNAKMSKGSFYHHFGDKFGLDLCMMDIVVKKKVSFFTPIIEENEDSSDFFVAIKMIVRGTMGFMQVDERFHHLFNKNMENGPALTERLIEFFPYDFDQAFGPIIQSAILSGQIDSRYSSHFISKILQLLFSNSHKLLTSDDSAEEIVGVIDQLVDLMQFGISAKKEAEE